MAYQVLAQAPGSPRDLIAEGLTLEEARERARGDFGHRRDMRHVDVRIETEDGALVEYAGPVGAR